MGATLRRNRSPTRRTHVTQSHRQRSGPLRYAVSQRIQQEARQRGYRPNAVARRLKNGRTNAVGLLFPVTPLPFYDISFVEITGIVAANPDTAVVRQVVVGSPNHHHQGPP